MRDPCEGLGVDGMIRTGADRGRVPAVYEPVIAAVLDAFEGVGDDAAELHLYGSVANGTARVGRSDVDLVAIDVPQDWAWQTGQRLSARFVELCGVEIGRGSRGDYLADGDEAYGNRVFLRHYCVPLAGGLSDGGTGMADGAARSDLDVYVVLADAASRGTTRTPSGCSPSEVLPVCWECSEFGRDSTAFPTHSENERRRSPSAAVPGSGRRRSGSKTVSAPSSVLSRPRIVTGLS